MPVTRISPHLDIVKTQQLCRFFAIILILSVAFPSPSFAGLPFKWPTAASDKAKKKTDNTSDSDSSDSSKTPAKTDQPAADSATTPAAATAAPRTGPYSPDAVKHYNRGVELHQSGFLNQAIDEYKEALKADSGMEQAWSNLGGIYAAQRSYNKAMEAFEKALELKPDRPTTLNALATVLYARGKIEEAKQKWGQAVQIDPTFAAAFYNMGNALEGEKKPLDAISAYAKAIEVSPGMADAYYRIGCIFFKEKHIAQAKVLLSKAVSLSPQAEFVKEAKKQITTINSDIQNESRGDGPRDVKMNVVPPTDNATAPQQAPVDQPEAAPPAAAQVAPATKPDQTAAVPPADESSPSDKKHKHKKMNMFITQPPDATVSNTTGTTPSDQDLQEKPAQ